MRKIFYVFVFALFLFLQSSYSSEIGVVRFKKIDKTGGKPLMETLDKRKTDREFSEKLISNDILGNLLWAAGGVNRNNNKKTVPFARNKNDISIYVLRSDGVWLYKPEENLIIQVGSNGIEKNGIIQLVFVSDSPDYVKNGFAYLHAGSMYQNVALFCASVGLGNMVEGTFDEKNLATKLILSKDDKILITQKIGWIE
ncbi:MAG: hypothetical protein LBG48_03785 [Rickettsiales bacterium]|jgi:hypothetical protein|nr:hypothetical protein [Rickettsiales bacterium]